MAAIADSVKTARTDDDERVLFNADTGENVTLNETGSIVWDGLAAGLDIGELSDRLVDRYEVAPDHARRDTEELLRRLRDGGFVDDSLTRAPASAPVWPLAGDGPRSVDISITGRCNARCPYCSYATEMTDRPDVPTARWLSLFDELGGLPTRSVCLSGGEAFTRPDFWELLDGIIGNRLRYSILTNGSLITPETLDRFAEGKRRRRIEVIQVSVDGSCAEVHDRTRGTGSFDGAVRALRLLRSAGYPVTARVTVNRYNVNDLDTIAHLLLDTIGIQSFGTNDAMPMGAGRRNCETVCLSTQERVVAMERLAALAVKYPGRVTAMAGPLANHRMFAEMRRMRDEGATRPDRGYLCGCGCAFGQVAVLHDGAIVPCTLLPSLHLGSIGRDPIGTTWRDHPTMVALRSRVNIPLSLVPGCENCEWLATCTGSCPALAYELTGEINRANPHDCYRQFLTEVGAHELA